MQYIIETLIHTLKETVRPEIAIFFLSTLPIIELRGGLIAAAILRVNFKLAFLLCFLGNIFPVPFILLFLDKLFLFLNKTKFKKFVEKIENKAKNKSLRILKYKQLGLAIFVAIPFPGTGTWTGSLIAKFLGISFKKAFFSIVLGSFGAAIIMLIASYGILGIFN